MSSAVNAANVLISSRLPGNLNVRRSAACAVDTAMQTMPTGLASVPPVGPGDAGDADADIDAGPLADAARHRLGHRLAHRAVRRDQRSGRRRAGRSSTRCCRRPRCARRKPTTRAHRSAATSRARPCTTRPARCAAAASRSRSPTTSSSARPSRLNTSCGKHRAISLARPVRAPSVSDAHRRPARRQVQLDLARRGENRRLDRRLPVAPSAVDRLCQLFDPRFAAAGDLQHAPQQTCPASPRAAAARRPSRSSIGLISRGGPGRAARRPCAPASIHSPGAVPFGLASTIAPRGTIACRRLISGICQPRAANRRRIASVIDVDLRTAAAPGAAATTSRVRSSSVGPRPPVNTTRSARCQRVRELRRELGAIVADDGLEHARRCRSR